MAWLRCFVRACKRRVPCCVCGALFPVVPSSKLSRSVPLATISDREGVMRAFLIAIRITTTAVITLFAMFASAQTAYVDWKYYGRAVVSGKTGKTDLTCFYDASTIDHPTSGHVRVWTKCIDEKDMSKFDYNSDLGKKNYQSYRSKNGGLLRPALRPYRRG